MTGEYLWRQPGRVGKRCVHRHSIVYIHKITTSLQQLSSSAKMEGLFLNVLYRNNLSPYHAEKSIGH
jgi:hypothetical protein